MKAICFTGHRKLSKNTEDLSQRLYKLPEEEIKGGAEDFYAGGAVGWDLIASMTVIKLRKFYPDIKLHLVLPCPPQEQDAKWSEYERKEYEYIRAAADTLEQTSEHFTADCMKIRNARLVELSEKCFCYYDPKRIRSGTGQTVRMAQRKGIEIVNFFY